MSDSIDDFFADVGQQSVVQDPFRFKARLRIGAEAFTVLSKAENLKDFVNLFSGSVAAAGVAGATWYGGLGTLGSIGLSIGLVSTPIGWLAAAGVAGGAAVFGLNRLIKKAKKGAVDEVPKYVNTPLDVLATNMVNLMLPPMVYISGADGTYDEREREIVIRHFVEGWGISQSFIEAQYDFLVADGGQFDVEAWSEAIGQLSESKDISYEEICADLICALEAVGDADGVREESENQAIEEIRATLVRESKFLVINSSSVSDFVSGRALSVKDSSVAKWITKLFVAGDRGVSKSVEKLRIERLPTLWLLGKTGAGKSSFIKNLTDYTHVPIGMGFMPCTQTMDEYFYPEEKPLIKLLDTRGLGEAGYDSSSDVEAASEASDLIIVVAKLDEPNQDDVLKVLRGASRFDVSKHLLVLHTGQFNDGDPQIQRALAFNQRQFDEAWHGLVSHVRIDLYDENHIGRLEIEDVFKSTLPTIGLLIEDEKLSGIKAEKLAVIHPTILRYSGINAAAGAMPVVGSVSALAAQGAMIKAIAEHHGIEWSQQALVEFFSALGVSFVASQLASVGGRTLLSTVPMGGSVLSGGLSFASCYAIGRLADYYFFRKKNGVQSSEQELQSVYNEMFKAGQAVSA